MTAAAREPASGETIVRLFPLTGVLLLVRGASFGGSPQALAGIAVATLAWSLGSVLSTTRLPLADGAA